METLVHKRTIIEERFDVPINKRFSLGSSLLSLISLGLTFAVNTFFSRSLRHVAESCNTSIFSTNQLSVLARFSIPFFDHCQNLPSSRTWSWASVPFSLAANGAAIGFFIEMYLLSISQPFQLRLTRFMSDLHGLRTLNYALVLTSTTFAILCLAKMENPEQNLPWLMHGAFLLAGGLSVGGFFQVEPLLPVFVLALLLAQVMLPLTLGVYSGNEEMAQLISLSGLTQLVSVFIGADTPRASFGFHILSMLAGYFLHTALTFIDRRDPAHQDQIAGILLPSSTMSMVMACAGSFVSGSVLFLILSKRTYQAFRSAISFIVWTFLYGLLLADDILDTRPTKLSAVYLKKTPAEISIAPYGSTHPKHAGKLIDIPSIESLPETVQSLGKVVNAVEGAFSFIANLDCWFPQADVRVPLREKERLKVHDDGQDLFPRWYFGLMPRFPKEGRRLIQTPQPFLTAFHEGNLLPFMCQHGVGNALLQLGKEINDFPFFKIIGEKDSSSKPDGLVLNLLHLEKYANKVDYEPYGGAAFFKIKPIDEEIEGSNHHLALEWVLTPRGTEKIEADPLRGSFRRAERMVMSSLLFEAMVGKHLCEIHQAYNLLEGALLNSFDAKLNQSSCANGWIGHPFRLGLHLHLYSHALATEKTVDHLLQEGGVFHQVFALTHNGLSNYVTDKFNSFELNSDENWEYREKCMGKMMGEESYEEARFTCSLQWETAYKERFEKYADNLVAAMYRTDEEVEADDELQTFWMTIKDLFHSVPDRYGDFKTKEGISRFLSETIHHLTVRHEVYSTTALTGTADSRIMTSQVPKDGGTPGLDEWRSFVYIGLATAYPPFTNLVQDTRKITTLRRDLAEIFDDATPIAISSQSEDEEDEEEGEESGSSDGEGSSTAGIRMRDIREDRADRFPVFQTNQLEKGKLIMSMKKAFRCLTSSLSHLEEEWKMADNIPDLDPARDLNYMYMVPLPESLHTGPGF